MDTPTGLVNIYDTFNSNTSFLGQVPLTGTSAALTISTLAAAGMLPEKKRGGASPVHVHLTRSSVRDRDLDQSQRRRDAA